MMPRCCEEMPNGCPCTSVLERHRGAVLAVMAVVAAAALTIPIGAVLGIVAFFRTL